MKINLIVLVILVVLASCKQKKEQDPIQVDVAPQDTVQVIEQPVVETPVVVDEGVNQDDRYFLVINSYSVKEIAEEKNQIYRNKGFNSDLVMKDDDGYHRLALKSFDKFSLAKEALTELQKEEEFKEVWIMAK